MDSVGAIAMVLGPSGIQQASTGAVTPERRAAATPSATAWATSSLRDNPAWTWMTRRESISPEVSSASVQERYCSGPAEAIISTGLETLAAGGRNEVSRDRVGRVSSGST